MTIVEHIKPGFQWADPLNKSGFEVEQRDGEVLVTGLLPFFKGSGGACDLFQQYEVARKNVTMGQKRTGKRSPHIRFANADTDKKLIAFVRQFGPVVAKRVDNVPEPASVEPGWRPRILARQDLKELRNERVIYRAALALILELRREGFDFAKTQQLIREIAAGASAWPAQWERERSRRKHEPSWKLATESLKRIQQLSTGQPDPVLSPAVDARIVVCEVLNAFRSTVFPNPIEMLSSIQYGIRPLLYAILRREFLHARDVAACENTQCRSFFEIERQGQRFCCEDCSRRQRQRDYWHRCGKELRNNRLKKREKVR